MVIGKNETKNKKWIVIKHSSLYSAP